jgi:hypothetical protein
MAKKCLQGSLRCRPYLARRLLPLRAGHVWRTAACFENLGSGIDIRTGEAVALFAMHNLWTLEGRRL